MALRGTAIAAFVIPIVFSFVYGGSVLSLGLSDQPGTGLVFQSTSDAGSISIIGLKGDYAVSENISAQVSVTDPAYECGDLYVTIYDISSEKKAVSQNAFFDQCYGTSGILPLNEEFSEKIDKPGKYLLVAQLFDSDGNKFLTAEKQITVN
ncbi:hypothetical protein [Candidatus Nitrosotenuis sp. DW1]|uniref:hypothetical protein n=1 Tax=Candidatus Nitrosotenuis sp. DW1 TaxID=2259672 RepID=UPI0015CE1D34|nr:hypothetical protein [Candidatus Nitrosotenuis sp. DW1]QLH09403.1 hypothetical protein DSQ19_07885 [Candidatus Nitrosotenuis sp. DW1]